MIRRFQTCFLLCVLCIILILSGCSGKETQPQSAKESPKGTTDAAVETPSESTSANAEETAVQLVLEGPGNTSANLLHDGLAAEYDGYIYHVDEMMAGSIWKMPVGGGESALIQKGTFHDLNVNGGVIFALGYVPNPDTGLSTYGIFMMNTDGSNMKVIKEGNFEELILYDEYLYFADIIEGGLYRMKYDSSDEALLLADIYDDFTIIDDALYIYASLGEDYTTNIYKMPLDGSALAEMIVQDTFGGAMDVALGEIYYIARDNTNNMYRYNTEAGENDQFLDKWVDSINAEGEYLYYFWTGNRQDNADSGMYRMKQDGSEAQMIMHTESLFSINIAGGKMFWHNNDEQRRLTVMNLDGTELTFVEQASA